MSRPIRPTYGAGKSLAVTATSARVSLPTGGTTQVLLFNRGAEDIFVALGGSSVEATVVIDLFIAAGTGILISREAFETYVAAIAESGNTSTLQINTGTGN